MLRGVRPALAPPPPRAARLFGRARVLSELREIARPLTLVGPSGVGKTEIALHLLATAEGDDHVFVDLTHARDLDEVLAVIAATLDVRTQRDMIGPLREAISARQGLLVLDRCERAGDAVAEALSALRLEVPLVCTATRPLEFSGERLVTLDPLDRDAVALFCARSPMIRDPSTRERALIAELCTLAGGLPFAIELIASWDEEPLQLVRELDPRVDPERVLRSVASWSVERLDAIARIALAQASVIEGPFESETFEAIVELPVDVAPLDVLSTLASVSLVGRAPRADARFVIAPVVRQLSIEWLGDGERLRALRRHARYFATSLRDVVERSRERSDVLAAHELALVDDELPAQVALALAEQAIPALLRHGPLEAALGIADATLARAPSAMLEVLAARARSRLGMPVEVALTPATPALALAIGELCVEQSEHRAAIAMLQDAVRDPSLAAEAHRLLAEAHVDDPREAIKHIDRAIELRAPIGPLLARRAAFSLEIGDAARARTDAIEALTFLVEGRDDRASALAMLTLADAQPDAHDALASARKLARRAGDLALLNRIDALAAARALATGDLGAARALFERVVGPLGEALRAHHAALSACRPSEPPRELARWLSGALSVGLAADGSKVVVPSGTIVFDKRPVLRKLLQTFIAARLATPGRALSISELFAAGWPGERIPPGMQGDRVHASLASLRELGLRRYLVTLTGGWALDPDWAFEIL